LSGSFLRSTPKKIHLHLSSGSPGLQKVPFSEDVLISGFGRFCVKDKKERRGRNPQTGDDMIMDARRIVTFKCSGVLKEKINGKG